MLTDDGKAELLKYQRESDLKKHERDAEPGEEYKERGCFEGCGGTTATVVLIT